MFLLVMPEIALASNYLHLSTYDSCTLKYFLLIKDCVRQELTNVAYFENVTQHTDAFHKNLRYSRHHKANNTWVGMLCTDQPSQGVFYYSKFHLDT